MAGTAEVPDRERYAFGDDSQVTHPPILASVSGPRPAGWREAASRARDLLMSQSILDRWLRSHALGTAPNERPSSADHERCELLSGTWRRFWPSTSSTTTGTRAGTESNDQAVAIA